MSLPTTLAAPTTIWTIGHSTRPIEEFLGLLAASRIASHRRRAQLPGFAEISAVRQGSTCGDVWPHTDRLSLVACAGRSSQGLPDSPNTAWRNASFRGYADYMSSPEFAQGLIQLLELSGKGANGDNVLGSGLVALPSLDDR